MTIDCTLSIRDESGTYYINAYVTLLSLFDNTQERVRVHILHDETIRHGKADLEALAAEHGQEILFHRVPDFDAETARKLSQWFTLGTAYRFFVPEIVEADTAIHLDCDLIVNRDIRELYDIPLGNRLVAAAIDHSNYWKRGKPKAQYREKVAYLGLAEKSYFGAGVMLMNLARMRELSAGGNIFIEKTLRALADGIILNYPDQDILNAVCASVPEGLLALDDSFNCWNGMLGLSLAELKGRIVHYNSSGSKPDKAFFPAHLLYWLYYARTPFAGDMFARMDAAFAAPGMRFLKLYVNNTKQRRHAEDLLDANISGAIVRTLRRTVGLR
jgi:lipopolysaccharide biosynthesis glycosyltransferase